MLIAGALLAVLSGFAEAATVVSLTFDDNTAGHAQAAQILDARGLKGTFYVNSSRVSNSPTYVTRAQLDVIAAAGHEIAGHTLSHLDVTTLTAAQRQTQVCDDRAQLQAWGYDPVSFAYPFGAWNNAAITTIRGCGYVSARIVGGLACSGCPAAEPIAPANAYAIRTPPSVRSNTTLAQLQQQVINAENSGGGWLPMVFHLVCDNCGELAVSPSTLSAFADWLLTRQSQGTAVQTVRQAMGASPPPSPPPPPPASSTQTYTLWASTEGPTAAQASSDPGPVFLGTRFRTDRPGQATAVRFFKRANSAGPRTGQLWTGTGTLLGSVGFAVETSTGWQQASFSAPISISSGVSYVVSYRTQSGYAVATQYFTAPRLRGPLTAPATAAGAGNGVYVYSAAATAFPAQTTNASNYWADVVFSVSGSTAAPPPANNPVPSIAALSPSRTAAGSPAFTLAVEGSGFVAGSVVRWNGADRATAFVNSGRLTAPIPSGDVSSPSTATVTVFSPAPGGGLSNGAPFVVDPAPPPPPPTGTATTLWTTQGPASNEFYIDPQPVNVGVRLRSDVAGQINGLRYYKLGANNGTHVGRLYTNTGTLLGSLTFGSETASGWQTATFASPIPIQANTLYVAALHSPTGYSVTRNYFTSSRDNPPLHAPAGAPGALNGLYLYGASPAFPTQSTNASNYWVDVVFTSGAGGTASLMSLSSEACPECGITDLERQRAYPNPWRGDRDGGKPLVFDQMPRGSEIKIYSVTGALIRTLRADAGAASWDLTSETGERLTSGFYLYRISAPGGAKKTGKLALIR